MAWKKIVVSSRSFCEEEALRRRLLEKFENVTFLDQADLTEAQLSEALQGADAAIVGRERISSGVLESATQLKLISKYGVGLDNLDLEAMKRRKVKLAWKPGVNSGPVAELSLMMILALLRRVPEDQLLLRSGIWKRSRGEGLRGKTLGVIGCGHVGKKLIELIEPFDCSVLVFDRVEYKDFFKRYSVRFVPLEELLSQSDVISLHLPLTSQTKGMLNAEKLSRMKSSAYFVNTARAEIASEEYLISALREGRLRGLALDVFQEEPVSNSSYFKEPRLLMTPHIGGSSQEAILAMGEAAIEGLLDGGCFVEEYSEYE